jgi:hypothetical protein
VRRIALAAALAVAVAGAAGCGGESGDLIAVEVAGGPAGGERTLVLTNDGRGRCDGGDLRPVESDRLIEAREIERDLRDLAEDGADLGGDAADDRRAYVARIQAGTVRWVEAEPGNPTVLPRLELLALQLGRELCS